MREIEEIKTELDFLALEGWGKGESPCYPMAWHGMALAFTSMTAYHMNYSVPSYGIKLFTLERTMRPMCHPL